MIRTAIAQPTRTTARALVVLAVTASLALSTPVVDAAPGPIPLAPMAPLAAAAPGAQSTDAGPELIVEPGRPGIAPRRTAAQWSRASRFPTRPADVLTLQTDPGAPRTIYLDFDGATVTNTAWDKDQGLAPGPVGPWDPAGDGAALSAAEADIVYETWARVAEDFAPFRVNVTTQNPGVAAIERRGREDARFGVPVVITSDPRPAAQIVACNLVCSGIAFRGVFPYAQQHRYYSPAFVFTTGLGRYSTLPAAIGGVASHEAGHTLGLSHDDKAGDDNEGYYGGHDPWAPIMGSAFEEPVTQWSRGDFEGSINREDDFTVMRRHGIALRKDKAGQTLTTAVDYTDASRKGVITTRKDVDLFRLRGCAGRIGVIVDVAPYGANLDVASQLFDANLGPVGPVADDPAIKRDNSYADGLRVVFETTLPETPADYYVSVDGVGNGRGPVLGYDDYGSVGQYDLQVTGCGLGAPSAPQRLQVTGTYEGMRLDWQPPASIGGTYRTGYDIYVDGVVRERVVADVTRTTLAGLNPGQEYRFEVAALNQAGPGARTGRTVTVPVFKAPGLGRVRDGKPGGKITAVVSWVPPTPNAARPVLAYRVLCYQLGARGQVVRTLKTGDLGAKRRAATIVGLDRARYRFAVQARTSKGWGPVSRRSRIVLAR